MSSAPIVTWTPGEGHRLATAEEAEALLSVKGAATLHLHGGRLARRLSCSDPCDQRAVYYFAALHIVGSKVRAIAAVAVLEETSDDPDGHLWILDVENVGYCRLRAKTRAEYTEALCAAIWGTK